MIDKELMAAVCPVESGADDSPIVVQSSFPIQTAAVILSLFGLVFTLVPAVGFMMSTPNFAWGFGPFIAVVVLMLGLVIDAIAVYFILKCFNPKPVIVLTEQAMYPGSEFEVGWMFQGNTASIQKLKLELMGTEKASYQQGTSTRTETSIFHRSTLLETSEPSDITKGFCMVRIPADSMHSFKSKNNEIRWEVSIHGTIPRWPDVYDSFQLQVLTPPVQRAVTT